MVRTRLLFFALLLLPLTGRPADSPLNIVLDRHSLEYGRYVQATLRYSGNQSLEDLDLSPWRKVAAIYPFDEQTETDNSGNRIQILQLRLYPRRTGTTLLPALIFAEASSQPRTFQVTSPEVDGYPINLEWELSTTNPWQRELTTLQVQLTTGDHSAHVLLDAMEHKTVISKTVMQQTNKGETFQHRGGWLLYLLKGEDAVLDLPPVRYRLSGSDQRWFHLPLIQLKIKPLPPYIPPNLPVGELNATSAISHNDDDNPEWQVRLTSAHRLFQGLPGLDVKLAQFSQQPLSKVSFQSTAPAMIESPLWHAHYQVPLPKWLSPIGPALKLELKYFDTGTGQLVIRRHTLPRTLRMPGWAWVLLSISLVSASGYLIYRLWPAWLSRYNQRALARKIQSVDDPCSLRHTLVHNDGFQNLLEWADQNPARRAFMHDLNHACFSGRPHNIRQLRDTALRALKTR